MKTKLISASVAAVLTVAALTQNTRAAEAQKPNIVFILMDNLGYGEVGCYGGGIVRGAPTPRISKHDLEFNARWVHEFENKNHVEGDVFMLNTTLKF